MRRLRYISLGFLLAAAVLCVAGASDRLVLFEYLNNAS